MRVVGESSEEEMVACFLLGELTSMRFGPSVREALSAAGLSERLLTEADLADEKANRVRRELLGATRGYGQNRELFDAQFPARVRWVKAVLTSSELAHVRYMDYSYWNELSGGCRSTPLGVSERGYACSVSPTAGSSTLPAPSSEVNASHR